MRHNFCDETIKKSGVYKITRPNGVVVYVGSAFSFIKRFHCHRAQLRGGYHHSIVLQRIYNKHGDEHLTMGLLDVCDIEDLPKREVEYIAEICPIANSSKEYKASMLGRKHTDETKQKMSKSQKGKVGKPLSDETKKKISDLHKGKKKTQETKDKMSRSKTGSKNAMFGIKAHNSRKVKAIYENSVEVFFSSLLEAQNITGADFRNIQLVCAGKRKKANGIFFQYAS
jgi:group I intron endonuclease